jgi:hypothetical protein
MGVSTDAYLVFGICLPEGDGANRFDHDHGGDPKKDENLLSWMKSTGKEVDGVKVLIHCSDEHPMIILRPAVEEAEYWAWRGEPTQIQPTKLDNDQHHEWVVALKNFCEKHKLPYTHPKWWLCSYWG